MKKTLAVIACFCGSCMFFAGCVPPKTHLNASELLANFNENASKVPYFKAEGELVIAAYVDGWVRVYNRSEKFTVLLGKDPDDRAKACDFALYVRGDFGEPIFGLGSSRVDGLYYFFAGIEQSGICRIGQISLARSPKTMPMSLGIANDENSNNGSLRDKMQQISINPLQLVSAFGVIPPASCLSHLPGAILEMQAQHWPFEYILTRIDSIPTTRQLTPLHRMIFRWDDKTTPKLPHRIEYLDTNSNWVMTAQMKKYKPIDTSDLANPPKESPVIPSEIIYTWRDVQTGKRMITLTLNLADIWMPDIDYAQACQLTYRIPQGLINKAISVDAINQNP